MIIIRGEKNRFWQYRPYTLVRRVLLRDCRSRSASPTRSDHAEEVIITITIVVAAGMTSATAAEFNRRWFHFIFYAV